MSKQIGTPTQSSRQSAVSPSEDELRRSLFPVGEQDYGPLYREHSLSIYVKYAETAKHISDRRQNANTFFLSINTALVAFLGYTGFGLASSPPNPRYCWAVLVAGVVLSLLWARLLKSYRDLNTAKFRILHETERVLPIAPFRTEWEVLGSGKVRSTYWPLSYLERIVPFLFILMYVVLFILTLVK
jgi:hypothetical protein